MEFEITSEQRLIVDTTRAFVHKELMPYEELVEQQGEIPPELVTEIRSRSIEAGMYAANMPEEIGGGGLDNLTIALFERELGVTSYGLQYIIARPSNILRACDGNQVEEYLLPTVRGDRVECLAMSEPDAGSDLRGMKTRAVQDGDDFVITGTKHFISHADLADYVILFAASGEEKSVRGPRKRITAFLIDMGTPGFEVQKGYDSVSHRGYQNCILHFDQCRVPSSKILGEVHSGFEVANTWLRTSRLQVAATCLGRGRRALELATAWAAKRKQFGQPIGRFQGVSFKLADMALRLEAAELLTLRAAWKADEGTMTDTDAAMAKLAASEMLAFVTDEAIQIYGGMGLMSDLPLERLWRDARVERIWDGTSEIQRHIISRAMLRPLGA